MKADFKPHNIFFHYSCIGYHNDTEDYYDPGGILGPYPAPDDGIALLLYDLVPTGDIGMAGIPSRKLWALLNDSKTLTHEMGHALGLYHTHHNTTCANWSSMNELVNGNQCDIRGDYVCETKAAPDFVSVSGVNYATCTFSNSTCVDPNLQPYTDADPKNIMSYGSICRDYFEDEQGEKMRNTLTLDPLLEPVQRNWAYITGTMTIEEPMYADVDVIVSAGSTLNFNDILQFAPERKIIVETAGRLYATNATFTKGGVEDLCPTDEVFWGGIHLASGTPYNYSLAIMQSCTLKHAKTGITWFKPSHTAINGRFRIYNTLFLNNESAIHLTGRYANNVGALPSTLSGCKFDIDTDYEGDVFDQHVHLIYANQGISILESQFTKTLASLPGKKRGITAYASRVAMVESGLHAIQAELEKFDQGINARIGSTYNPAITFRNVDFDLNTWGVNALAVNNLSIRGCEFNVPNTSGGYAGIGLQAGTGFLIFDNDFISPGSSVAGKFGIRLSQTTTASNVIYENMFNNMGTANIASGINGGTMSGLQYLCNTVSNSNQHDFYINAGATIAHSQGIPTNPAGNKFTLNQSPQAPDGSDFYNALSNPLVTYHFFNGDPLQDPDNVVNIDKAGHENVSSCLYRNLLHTELDTLDMAFDRIKDEYDSLSIAYGQAIGTGPKQIIASQIRDADIRMNIVCNAALQVIQNDTLTIDWDLTRDWLDRKNSFSSDIEIATTYLSEDDESSFHTFVSSIPGRRLLTANDSTDYNLFVDLTSLLLGAKGEDRADSELDSLEVESLEDIGLDNDRMVAGMAKGILETFYGYTFADTIMMRSTQEEGESESKSLIPIQVYPQPFFDVVLFQFPIGSYELRILDLVGRVISQIACEDCNILSWHSNQTPDGIYVFELISNQVSHTGLLLKVN